MTFCSGSRNLLRSGWGKVSLKNNQTNMKEISASIIFLASAVLVIGGMSDTYHDLRDIILVVGCITGITGFFLWITSFLKQ